MKKFLLLFVALLGISVAAQAQGAIKYPGTDPTGTACGGYDFALYHGNLYSCTAGVFAALPVTSSGNANFVLYPSSSPNGNACNVSNGIDPLAQVYAGTVYTCQSSVYTAVAGGGGGGTGNVSNSGTPLANQWAVWVDALHIKGIAISGDCTASGLGVWTCTKTNNISFGPLATQAGASASAAIIAGLTFTPENAANKDSINGYAGLDASTLLKASEFPTPTTTTFGGVKDKAAVANNFVTSLVNGVPVLGRPTCANLSDSGTGCAATLAPVATSGSATDISTGTLNNARLPAAISVTTLAATGSVTGSSFVGTAAGGVGNNWLCAEGTDPGTEAAGKGLLYCDSAAHTFLMSINGSAVAGNSLIGANQVNTAGSGFTLNLAAASVLTGLKLPSGAGAAPTIDGQLAQDTTTHTLRCGNGTTTTRCMVIPLITGVNGGAPLNGSTQFVKIVGGTATAATEAQTRQMLSIAGVVTNLCVTTTATQSGTGNMTLTFRDSTSASNSSLVATVAAGAVAGTYCDGANSATVVAQHDYVLILVVNSSVPGATIEGIGAIYTY